MKKFASAILFFFTLISLGQNNFIAPDTANQGFLNLRGGIASSSVPQAFINKFIFPDFIDNELKDAASKKIKKINYFGASVSGNFNFLSSYKEKSAKKGSFYGFGFGTNLEANLRFSDDLFNLTFYGNQPFTNQTLNLDKCNFNSLSYSYFEVSYGQSFINKRAKSIKCTP